MFSNFVTMTFDYYFCCVFGADTEIMYDLLVYIRFVSQKHTALVTTITLQLCPIPEHGALCISIGGLTSKISLVLFMLLSDRNPGEKIIHIC